MCRLDFWALSAHSGALRIDEDQAISGERRRAPSKFKPIELGPLPVEMINRTLGTELEAGEVRVSSKAHKHIAEDHAEDYEVVLENIEATITTPTFLGQAPHHARNIELVRRVRLEGRLGYVLVAVGLEPDDHGSYRVCSAYLIKPDQVESRRLKRRLLPPK